MYQCPSLPTILRNNIPIIKAGYQNVQIEKYDPIFWRASIANQTYNNHLISIENAFGKGQITRSDIKQLAIKALNENATNIQEFFMAVMLWGYATTNYGPWRTNVAIDSGNVESQVKIAIKFILGGKVDKAYASFNLPWIGPAFFTKFLYFIGLSTNCSPLPLILDSRVANSLLTISKIEGWPISYFVKYTPNREGGVSSVSKFLDGYMRYVGCMNTWAQSISCPADYIEYFLFNM